MIKDSRKYSALSAPFAGCSLLISRPRLWGVALSSLLLSCAVISFLFVNIAYFLWPQHHEGVLKTSLTLLQVLALSSTLCFLVWVLVFSFVLMPVFKYLVKKSLIVKETSLQHGNWKSDLSSYLSFFIKTFAWRFSWFCLALASVFIAPACSFVIIQIGIVHLVLMDGCELSLSLQGQSLKTIRAWIKKRQLSLLFSAIVSGLISLMLLPTLIVWLFWIPGIYIGTALWVAQGDLYAD